MPIQFLDRTQTRLIDRLEMGLGYHIKLKQLVTGDKDRIKKVICEALSPTPLGVKDVIRRVCHKEGGEGTLTLEASSHDIAWNTVQIRCEGGLLDYAKLRDSGGPAQEQRRLASIKRFDRIVETESLPITIAGQTK